MIGGSSHYRWFARDFSPILHLVSELVATLLLKPASTRKRDINADGINHNRHRCMNFVIEVGEVEKQLVEFDFNQLLGRTVIRSNGREIKRQVRLISEPVFESHVVDFGEYERLQLKIEKRRQSLRSSRYTVYVNNRLATCCEGR